MKKLVSIKREKGDLLGLVEFLDNGVRKFITRALDNKRERLRKIIEYYFKEKN